MVDSYGEKIVSILGLSITLSNREDVIRKMREWLLSSEQRMIVTGNPDILLRARVDKKFKKIVDSANLITADGVGVCWAAKFLEMTRNEKNKLKIINIYFRTLCELLFCSPEKRGKYFPDRITGADLTWDLAKIAEKENKKIYLIGGKKQTAFRAAQKIKEFYPELDIKAFKPDHVASPCSSNELQNELEEYKPDIVLVAYGAPKQEEWIENNLKRHNSIKIAMGIGGTLDFIAGNTIRASLRIQSHGLEWFWRLCHEPTRILRVFRSVVAFPLIILFSRLRTIYAK
jgi:N-acetylglucosaminyldiphosphoundecaprenol N-acetyl-beta-D-mannosaminyltransferase